MGTMTEESEEETMTGEDIMATKEVDMAREMKEEQDMKSVVGEIGMKVGETEIETTEERETRKIEAPKKEIAEAQARGTIEEMGEMQTTGAGREIMTEKGMKGIVRRGRIGQLREAWIG